MKTFNQLATRAYSFAGKPNDGGEAMTNIKADLVTGLSLFKNAARRYWRCWFCPSRRWRLL